MEINAADPLTRTFSALADPTRRAILARLALGEADVGELMSPFHLSQPAISKHLKVLEKAGLIVCARDAQRRPRRLSVSALRAIDDWLDGYRSMWEERFASLDKHLAKTRQPKE
jgi:DNA-binding transcriptional ArsR family regulator